MQEQENKAFAAAVSQKMLACDTSAPWSIDLSDDEFFFVLGLLMLVETGDINCESAAMSFGMRAKAASMIIGADVAASGITVVDAAVSSDGDILAVRAVEPEPQATDTAGDWADTVAHEILGAHCGCYAEAWPAHTCANEAAAVAEKIRLAAATSFRADTIGDIWLAEEQGRILLRTSDGKARAAGASIMALVAAKRRNDASLILRHKADMRAIKRWQEARPGNDLVFPSHDDLVVWLLEQVERPRPPISAAALAAGEEMLAEIAAAPPQTTRPYRDWRDEIVTTEEDYAAIGRSLMNALDVHTQDPNDPLHDWTPAEDPAEVVGDLVDMVREAQEEPPATMAALAVFADIANYIDSETIGMCDADELCLCGKDASGKIYGIYDGLKVRAFRDARAAMAQASGLPVPEGEA